VGVRTAASATRIAVDVTFLRMAGAPEPVGPPLPEGYTVRRIAAPTVALYRRLYNGVGDAYCWWLRRIVADNTLIETIRDPRVSIHVLYDQGREAGFYELDRLPDRDINIAYFGLLPGSIGRGIGRALLDHAIAAAWAEQPRALRVNTCTADHPRALPTYVRAGFVPFSTVREIWDIPNHLGLVIPERLRVR